MNPKLSGVGLALILCGFVVVSYYTVVIGWSLIYSYHSFFLSWGEDAGGFFINQVLNSSEGPDIIGNIQVNVLLALIAAWILIYFCVWKGTESVEKVIQITVPLPIMIAVVLLIRGITLPGAMSGIAYYLIPNFSALWDFEIWSAAMSQIFFTLSVGFGIMIAYASYTKKTNVVKDAWTTALINSGTSILAGFVVFTTIGFMAVTSQTPIDELAKSGPSLAFIVFPEILNRMPGAPVFAFLFFVMLVTLAIDSAFSLVEAVTTVIYDSYVQIKRKHIALGVCAVGFLISLIFTTSGGLHYLDITDHYITTYGLVGAGLLETLVVGWVYGANKLKNEIINQNSDIRLNQSWNFQIQCMIPVCLVIMLITSLWRDISVPYEGYPGWAQGIGWSIVVSIFVISAAYSVISKGRRPAESMI